MDLTTSQQIALAILKCKSEEDKSAVMGMIDSWIEENNPRQTIIPPVTKINAIRHRLRAVFTLHPSLITNDVSMHHVVIRENYERWLLNGEPLILNGVTMQLYDMTHNIPCTIQTPGPPTQEDLTRISNEFERVVYGHTTEPIEIRELPNEEIARVHSEIYEEHRSHPRYNPTIYQSPPNENTTDDQ